MTDQGCTVIIQNIYDPKDIEVRSYLTYEQAEKYISDQACFSDTIYTGGVLVIHPRKFWIEKNLEHPDSDRSGTNNSPKKSSKCFCFW